MSLPARSDESDGFGPPRATLRAAPSRIEHGETAMGGSTMLYLVETESPYGEWLGTIYRCELRLFQFSIGRQPEYPGAVSQKALGYSQVLDLKARWVYAIASE